MSRSVIERDVDIVSGATVTVMVIDDSIVRAAVIMARIHGLGGLAPVQVTTGPRRQIDSSNTAIRDWADMLGDGSLPVVIC